MSRKKNLHVAQETSLMFRVHGPFFVLLSAVKLPIPRMVLRPSALVVPLVVPCSTAAAVPHAAVVSLSVRVYVSIFV
jgi:hypothetical protein